MRTQLIALLLIIGFSLVLVVSMITLVTQIPSQPTPTHQPPAPVVSPSPEPEQPAPLTACQLISKDQIAFLLGTSLIDPKESPVKNQSGLFQQGCLFMAESETFTPSVQINLTYQSLEDPTLVNQVWQAAEASSSALPRYQSIKTLPVPAYFNGQTFFILKENYIISIIVSLADPDQNRDLTLELAELILTNWSSLKPQL